MSDIPGNHTGVIRWDGQIGTAPDHSTYRVWSEACRGERRRWYVRYLRSGLVGNAYSHREQLGEVVWSGTGGDEAAYRAAERHYRAKIA